jgi:predicted RNase H-like HicB family nuclease
MSFAQRKVLKALRRRGFVVVREGGRWGGVARVQDRNLMKLYHVAVDREGDWYIGRVLERAGITTQGRTLDELVDMLHDAIEGLWAEKSVQLELILRPRAAASRRGRKVRRNVSA